VKIAKRFALLGVLAVVGTTGACNSFLTGGELSTDPNRPTSGTPQARFEATQPALWSLLSSDPARINDVWVQYFTGAQIQYEPINNYIHDEATTNGFHQALYTGGGLVDIREVENESRASGDSALLGDAQIMEAFTMGTGADLFGDLVYNQALTNTLNPTLDPQMDVYDHVQAVLDSAIAVLTAASGPTNFGPGSSDLVYNGDQSKWIALAHSLKARFFLHTAEVRGNAAYQSAHDEAALGITTAAGDYKAIFSGNLNEQNQWYQFDVVLRQGYLLPSPFFVGLLQSHSDPRLLQYFNAPHNDFSDTRLDPTFSQPLFTAQENLLIAAEASYRLGQQPQALSELNAARAIAASDCFDERGVTCVIPDYGGATGLPLLRSILTEKYIDLFQNMEAWNDYKRTCFPNLTPTQPGQIIPARWNYDTSERQTDTNIPDVAAQPVRNANDPANATDDFGAACLGQTP
jgi:hypothetical protein